MSKNGNACLEPAMSPALPERTLPARAPEPRIDGVGLLIAVGKWQGSTKVGEISTDPQRPLFLYAKDDGLPLPWGRALEELLRELLVKAEAAGQ